MSKENIVRGKFQYTRGTCPGCGKIFDSLARHWEMSTRCIYARTYRGQDVKPRQRTKMTKLENDTFQCPDCEQVSARPQSINYRHNMVITGLDKPVITHKRDCPGWGNFNRRQGIIHERK